MPGRIEDYAFLSDCRTGALVGRDGSIDWPCCPRFDSGACFAALLGAPEQGRWLLAPAGDVRRVRRRYRPGTMVLETTFETDDGAVMVVDAMPPFGEPTTLARVVKGKRGRVPMRTELVIRFDYGRTVPWVRGHGDGIRAVAGPDLLHLFCPVELRGEGLTTVAEFDVGEGQEVPFALRWRPSHLREPDAPDAQALVRKTAAWWRRWSGGCKYDGPWHEQVLRSLITLKGLTYAPTGGVAAAPMTSLPEQLGGVRNWDYRYCWLRDATFTLYALLGAGFTEEAEAWREWLLRAVAGMPSDLQIMYGLAGERRLDEWEVDWLPGYQGASPVRIGNAASNQFQLDVYGETLDALYQCRRLGVPPAEPAWRLEQALLKFLESAWHEPDEGIWEMRGPRRYFTHSRVMAWVAFDRAVKAVEKLGMDGPVDRWCAQREAIHKEVCDKGFDRKKNSFVQYYGSEDLDAALLMVPLVGFLPAKDPRVAGTVEAVRRELDHDGFVKRYPTREGVDGLPPGEGAFLPCSFWLADCLALMGKQQEATELFERLIGLCNDVGLISEEYDPKAERLVGNFPQAFSHVGLVNTALNLSRAGGPAAHRKDS